jgi:hypothetical protein
VTIAAEQLALDLGSLAHQSAPEKPKRARQANSPSANEQPALALHEIIGPPKPIDATSIASRYESAGRLPPMLPDLTLEIASPASSLMAEEPDASGRSPFGLWLLQQVGRKGWIGELAKGVRSDPGFPKRGSPDAVRARMREIGADGDAFEALDDAELGWLAA